MAWPVGSQHRKERPDAALDQHMSFLPALIDSSMGRARQRRKDSVSPITSNNKKAQALLHHAKWLGFSKLHSRTIGDARDWGLWFGLRTSMVEEVVFGSSFGFGLQNQSIWPLCPHPRQRRPKCRCSNRRHSLDWGRWRFGEWWWSPSTKDEGSSRTTPFWEGRWTSSRSFGNCLRWQEDQAAGRLFFFLQHGWLCWKQVATSDFDEKDTDEGCQANHPQCRGRSTTSWHHSKFELGGTWR